MIEVGDVDRAIGCLVRAWSLAQKWYLKPGGKIPISEWNASEINPAVVNVRLATVEGNFVIVSGADQQFGWLKQRSDAGRASRSKSLDNSINDRQRSLTDADGSKPLPLSLPPEEKKNTLVDSSNQPTHEIPDEVNQLVELWNEHCGKLPRVMKISTKRRRIILARLKELPDLNAWKLAIQELADSEFHTGKNDRGWKADFDFLMQPDKALKILEGI